MPLELSYLVACVAVFFVHLVAEAILGNLQYKPSELLGARDTMPENNPAVARAKRATSHMVEAMILFAPLILVAHATGRLNAMTELGAGLFLGARILYAPLYWFGVPVLRSIAWAVGVGGTIIVFFLVIPFSGAA